ncbi:hypothetical protein [Beijerinckia sp. L45]|uniref:hypothetical protein n=1 Tax=Beijerinckia sp. L45 TaxID=1641855 RepID=UPI00131CED43|nr:hypothetical protein [Beijerinckia sp. L45]
MGNLIAATLGTIVVGLAGGLILDAMPSLSERLIRYAAGRTASRFREENLNAWLADFDECRTTAGQIYWALGCVQASFVIEPPWADSTRVLYLVGLRMGIRLRAQTFLWVLRRVDSSRFDFKTVAAMALRDNYESHFWEYLRQYHIACRKKDCHAAPLISVKGAISKVSPLYVQVFSTIASIKQQGPGRRKFWIDEEGNLAP